MAMSQAQGVDDLKHNLDPLIKKVFELIKMSTIQFYFEYKKIILHIVY